MNAVVENVHLQIVEGVASVFGLTQLHRAKVKSFHRPQPKQRKIQPDRVLGIDLPQRRRQLVDCPPVVGFSRQQAKLAPHVAGVHVQRDVQILRLE